MGAEVVSLMQTTFELQCDGCSTWLKIPAGELTNARRRLRVLGWATRVHGTAAARDLCPTCRREHEAKLKAGRAERERARVATLKEST